MSLNDISVRGLIFLIGGLIYALIEIAARGYTHWSMVLTGGLCLVLMYEVHLRTKFNWWIKYLIGAIIITFFEFIVGVVVNLIMHWNVWDYSYLPFNLFGQICLPYFFIWYLVSIAGFGLCSVFQKRFA
ncbi:MAG: hypothetical protein ACI4WH_02125 [Oscillospiraceae bacterium]